LPRVLKNYASYVDGKTPVLKDGQVNRAAGNATGPRKRTALSVDETNELTSREKFQREEKQK
jgi:hypothetical protein